MPQKRKTTKRTATLEEFEGAPGAVLNPAGIARDARGYKSTGVYYVPVRVGDPDRKRWTADTLSLTRDDAGRLLELCFSVAFSVECGVYLFDADEGGIDEWLAGGWERSAAEPLAIIGHLCRHVEVLGAAMGIDSPAVDAIPPMFPGNSAGYIEGLRERGLFEDLRKLFNRLGTALELRDQEWRAAGVDPAPMKMVDYFRGPQARGKLISLKAVVKNFKVSSATLRRDIKNGKLTDHRPPDRRMPGAGLMLALDEVARLYPRISRPDAG